MSNPYVGEIRLFAGNFAPAGWSFCDGSLLPISENETLFNLIGTTYGGDGQSTFALPDMRGRLPMHQGAGVVLAELGGVEEVTLTVGQLPAHTHPFVASSAVGTGSTPTGNVIAAPASVRMWRAGAATNVSFPAQSIAATGGSQPHSNLQPYLCVNFIISLFGVFPSPT